MSVRILMIGNGSHDNRGCQAIDLGTLQVLRDAFGSIDAHVMPHTPGPVAFGSVPDGVRVRVSGPTGVYRRFSARWASRQAARMLGPAMRVSLYERWFDAVREAAQDADAVLALGGDNLTFDYGPPDLFWALDRAALAVTRNVFPWGVTIGPFGSDAGYERFAAAELSRHAAVFVRESLSASYLERIGVRAPVHLVADPAFALAPAPVDDGRLGFAIEEGTVGVNLSPLLAGYRHEDPDSWAAQAAQAVRTLAHALERPVVLVPHVVAPGNDDHAFLSRVQSALGGSPDVRLVPKDLDAAELKAVIARFACFVGARTHATIAALSSGVPTVSVAYSVKARGLNREVFGDERWVLDARALDGASLADAVRACLAEADAIRVALRPQVATARENAFLAGRLLRAAIGGGAA